MALKLVHPLHFHCPTCGHCAGAHQLVEGVNEALVLMCAGCRRNGFQCPADAFHSSRRDTLANIHAQSMHDSLWETGI